MQRATSVRVSSAKDNVMIIVAPKRRACHYKKSKENSSCLYENPVGASYD